MFSFLLFNSATQQRVLENKKQGAIKLDINSQIRWEKGHHSFRLSGWIFRSCSHYYFLPLGEKYGEPCSLPWSLPWAAMSKAQSVSLGGHTGGDANLAPDLTMPPASSPLVIQ